MVLLSRKDLYAGSFFLRDGSGEYFFAISVEVLKALCKRIEHD